MNLIQLMRRARQGVDAILPGGYASAQWSDEEMVDLTNEAYEDMQRSFRLVHRKWGLVTLNTSSSAFTREGETYTPSTSLVLTSTANKITLPPDFAQLTRIICTNDRTIRFFPAQEEMDHWVDLEQSGYGSDNNILASQPQGLVFYYDIIAQRTLFIIPATTGSYNLEIDYIPMFRPMYYSNTGTVSLTNGATTITGAGTIFVTDNIYTESSNQAAELIVGVSDPQANAISTSKDFPRVSTVTSNTAAALKANWGPATISTSKFILSMAPVFPREYHRALSRLTSSLMLSKVNPEISEKYYGKFMQQFSEKINPVMSRRQTQMSQIVEDADEHGLGEV